MVAIWENIPDTMATRVNEKRSPINSAGDTQGPAVCVLASGSRGNATYLSDGHTRILLDSGLSGIQIEHRLKSRGIRPDDLDAILVSHEHRDHISGVGVLSRRFDLPVYMTSKTATASARKIGHLREVTHFNCGTPFKINSLRIHPFSISHDAVDPAGFTFQLNGKKVGVATDLGVVTNLVKSHLTECTVLILEANHDPDMLINGPYAWPLKQRIMSRSGHLSNQDTGRLLAEMIHDRLQQVILAHLSEINNTPEKALSTIQPVVLDKKVALLAASQSDCGALISV
jgi:phosphoribosyl 1,2-cyclic phosphodiesterase